MKKTMRNVGDVAWALFDFMTLPVAAAISVGTGEVEKTIDIMDDIETRLSRLSDSVQSYKEEREREKKDEDAKESSDSGDQ